MEGTIDETIEVGGPEYLTFVEICKLVSAAIGIKRYYLSTTQLVLNIITESLEILAPAFPTSVFWSDYLAANRTTNLDTLPTRFDLLPAKMSQRLGYLKGKDFRPRAYKKWRSNPHISQRKKTSN